MRLLLLSLISTVLFAVFGLGWLGTLVYSQLEQKKSGPDDAVAGIVALGKHMAEALDASDNPVDADSMVSLWPENSNLQLLLADISDFPLPPGLHEAFKGGEPLLLEEGERLSINYFLDHHQQVMSLSLVNPKNEERFSASLLLTLFFYLGLIAMLILWFYPLLRRLVLLQRAAREFGAGIMDARIPLSPWTYIAPIENAFNQMATRVQNLLADNRLLSRAVSHDLKTPLARLRFGFEMLEESPDSEHSQRYLARIGQDLTEMEALINRLLDYAKLEEGQLTLDLKPLDLNQLVKRLIDEWPEEVNQFQLQLSDNAQWVQADAHYLKMLLNNLIANALRYAKSQVRINTSDTEKKVRLVVADDGPGIPLAEREDVLKPFIRGKSATKSGHGMGLAIVARVASWHGAQLTLSDDTELGGASVLLEFPKYEAH